MNGAERPRNPVRISVVVPTFNRPAATRRAVDSVLRQTLLPHEIIIVDDASVPPLVAADWTKDQPSIRLISLGQNVGPAAARQAGVDASTGDFLAFLDSDDQWLPEKLSRQVSILSGREDELIAVCCGWQTVPRRGAPIIRIPISSSDPKDFAAGCWFSPGSTLVIPRSAFARIGPFATDLRRLEDYEWFLRFGLAGGRLEVVPMVGALIDIDRRPRLGAVDAAARKIAARIPTSVGFRFSRRTTAYLALERAAAARNERRWSPMLRLLALSFLHKPRLTLHLKRWWSAKETAS